MWLHKFPPAFLNSWLRSVENPCEHKTQEWKPFGFPRYSAWGTGAAPMEGNWALKTFEPMPEQRWMKLLTVNNVQRGGTPLHSMTSSSLHVLSTLQDFPPLMSKAEFLFVWHLCVLSWRVGTVWLTWACGSHCEAWSLEDRWPVWAGTHCWWFLKIVRSNSERCRWLGCRELCVFLAGTVQHSWVPPG